MRSMVEGESRNGNVQDMRDDPLQIVQHARGRNPQRLDVVQYQPGIAGRVARRLLSTIMRFAIDLDAKQCVRTEKIERVGTRGMLTTEFERTGAFAQFAPEQDFRQRHFFSLFARTLYRVSRTFEHCPCPSTVFDGPPPRSGEEFQ